MDREWVFAVFLVKHRRDGKQGEGGVERFGGMRMAIHTPKDGHEHITSSIIDVTACLMEVIEKGRKIALDQRIERLWRQPLTQTGVTTDVKEEDRNVPLVLLAQSRRLRISGDEALDGLGHELGEVIFNPAQLADFAVHGVLEL